MYSPCVFPVLCQPLFVDVTCRFYVAVHIFFLLCSVIYSNFFVINLLFALGSHSFFSIHLVHHPGI